MHDTIKSFNRSLTQWRSVMYALSLLHEILHKHCLAIHAAKLTTCYVAYWTIDPLWRDPRRLYTGRGARGMKVTDFSQLADFLTLVGH